MADGAPPNPPPVPDDPVLAALTFEQIAQLVTEIDPEVFYQRATAFDQSAARLQEAVEQIRRELNILRVSWTGQAADEFISLANGVSGRVTEALQVMGNPAYGAVLRAAGDTLAAHQRRMRDLQGQKSTQDSAPPVPGAPPPEETAKAHNDSARQILLDLRTAYWDVGNQLAPLTYQPTGKPGTTNEVTTNGPAGQTVTKIFLNKPVSGDQGDTQSHPDGSGHSGGTSGQNGPLRHDRHDPEAHGEPGYGPWITTPGRVVRQEPVRFIPERKVGPSMITMPWRTAGPEQDPRYLVPLGPGPALRPSASDPDSGGDHEPDVFPPGVLGRPVSGSQGWNEHPDEKKRLLKKEKKPDEDQPESTGKEEIRTVTDKPVTVEKGPEVVATASAAVPLTSAKVAVAHAVAPGTGAHAELTSAPLDPEKRGMFAPKLEGSGSPQGVNLATESPNHTVVDPARGGPADQSATHPGGVPMSPMMGGMGMGGQGAQQTSRMAAMPTEARPDAWPLANGSSIALGRREQETRQSEVPPVDGQLLAEKFAELDRLLERGK